MQAACVGVDTIRASIEVPAPLDELRFSRKHEINTGRGQILKLTNADRENMPRLTYYPNDKRLICEISLPKLSQGHNITPVDPASAIIRLDEWLGERFDLPSVGDWTATRVDYFASWKVDELMPDYLAALSTLELPRYERISRDNSVVWKAKTRHITWYDKFRESGQPESAGHLRFEVSNRKSALQYMRKEYGCALVSEWIGISMSHEVVAHFLTRLGVGDLVAHQSDIGTLKQIFPRSWAQAKTYLELIEARGRNLIDDGTMSKTTFYRYRKALSEAGLLGANRSERTLPGLRLDPEEVKIEKYHKLYVEDAHAVA